MSAPLEDRTPSGRLRLPLEHRPTQTDHPGRATARTGVAMLVPTAFVYPLLVDQFGERTALLIMCGLVVGNALVTRLMATPLVESVLRAVLPWLAAEPATPPDTESEGRHRK